MTKATARRSGRSNGLAVQPLTRVSRAQRRKLRYGPGGTVRYRLPESAGGGIHVTSSDQAHAYVAAGRARWDDDGVLIFVSTDRRCIAAARPHYTDGVGLASLEAIRGLPCIQPWKALLSWKRKPVKVEGVAYEGQF